MSIEAAAKELTKEIDRLTKEAGRLAKLRDSLQPGVATFAATSTLPAARKTAAKKSLTKKATPAKKRVLSPEGRQNIIKATKRRWAAKKKAAAAEKKKAASAEKKQAATAEK